ncbi:MAG TPA: SpoIIE family protein phosphatase [Candidatus Polarisedimenticolia bacterium]|nr:SpoIIE family protein phosphatase [Candidatus Polarisedimenticolia bacterium]
MRLPLRWKLILAISLPAIAVWGAMSWILADQAGRRSERRLEEESTRRIGRIAALIESRVERIAATAGQAAAAAGKAPDLSEAASRSLLEAALENEPAILRAGAAWKLPGEPGAHGIALTRAAGGFEAETLPEEAASRQTADTAGWKVPEAERGPGLVFTAPFARPSGGQGDLSFEVSLEDLCAGLPVELRREGAYALAGPQGRILCAFAPPGSRLPEEVSLPEIVRKSGRADLEDLGRRIASGETGIARAPGLLTPDRRWFAYAPIHSLDGYLIASVPESVVLAFSRSQIYIGFVLLSAGLAALLGIIIAMSTRITAPLSHLSGAVAELGTGNLKTRVTEVPAGDEIGDLAASFNRMVGDLERHVEALQRETAAREKVEGELRVARGIQTALLPKRLPTGSKFEISATNLAARHVAGDFYDAFLRNPDTLVLLVADVSGKGLPAALFMAVSRTVLRRLLHSEAPLSEVLAQANESLEGENVGGMYVTLFAGIYDIPSGTLRYANAAHPVPHRIDARGKVTDLGEVTGTMVGLLPARTYEEKVEHLAVGDRILIVTDGVPEAKDAAEEFFGDERLKSLLGAGDPGETADALRRRVIAEVERYQGENLADDVTVMALRRLG